MDSTCVICSKSFTLKKGSSAKTCSPVCRERYRVQRTVEASTKDGAWVTRECAVCGKEFTRRKGKVGVVCSVECRTEKQRRDDKEDRTCTVCSNVFNNYHRQSQNTCSVSCAAKARSNGRNYPSCEVCGEPTGGYDRAFCPTHRRSRSGRKPMPRLTAICVGCGEEFSRPGHWKGQMKYCSNKCSHHEVKSVRDKFVLNLNDKAIVFHSGWEIRFVAVCMRLKIDWRRYDGPDFETSVGTYRPDFIIGPDDLIIEVKGWEARPGTPEKLAESGALVIGKAHLEVLEGCSYADTFWRAIEMLREPVVMA